MSNLEKVLLLFVGLLLITTIVLFKRCTIIDPRIETMDSIAKVKYDSTIKIIDNYKIKLKIQDSLRRKYHIEWINLYNLHCKQINKYETKLKNYRRISNMPIDSVERYITNKL